MIARIAVCFFGLMACNKLATPLVDAGQDAGPGDAGQDAGIDCTRHCTIDGGTYCANETAGGWYACWVCEPDQSTSDWTTLPIGTPCATPAIQASPGKGACFAQGGTGLVYCACSVGSSVCSEDQECCAGVCYDAGLFNECRALPGEACYGADYVCLTGRCCIVGDAGQCSADDGSCPAP
jgi:hypothetical protein